METNIDRPWLAQRDWRRRRVAQTRYSIYLWTITAVLVLASAAWLYAVDDPGRLLLPGVLGIIACLTFFFAVTLTIREVRFGSGVLELSRVPFFRGEMFSATLRLRRLPAGTVFTGTLKVVYEVSTGSGRSAKVRHHTLWEEMRQFAARPGADGRSVILPIEFQLPNEAPGTSRPSAAERIDWILETSAEAGTIDFKMDHRIPVFAPTQMNATDVAALRTRFGIRAPED